MPALVTHDYFGKQAQEFVLDTVGTPRENIYAFLLGNQGPDPLFYLGADPLLHSWEPLGTTMHRDNTNVLLASMKRAIAAMPAEDRGVARAYALGFLCHYLLDSTVHPLVYAQQYALCAQGVEGLDRRRWSDVHITIEREFDEVVITDWLESTLADYPPAKLILRASNHTLDVISAMYVYTTLDTYHKVAPENMFTHGVKLFRAGQRLFYSPTGIKRTLLVHAEQAVHSHSYYGELSMVVEPRKESVFENRAHDPWIDPATSRERTESFQDLFNAAMQRVEPCATIFLAKDFDAAAAEEITRGLEFNGKPIGGALVVEEA